MIVSTNQTRRYLKLTRRVTTCYMWRSSGTCYQGNNGGLWWGSNSRLTGIHRSPVIRATHCATPHWCSDCLQCVTHAIPYVSLFSGCLYSSVFRQCLWKECYCFRDKIVTCILTNLQCFFALIHSIFPTLLCLYIDMWTYRCNTVSSFPFFDVDSCICISLCQFQPSKLKLYTHTV